MFRKPVSLPSSGSAIPMGQLSLFDNEGEAEGGWGLRVPHPIPYQGSKRNLAQGPRPHQRTGEPGGRAFRRVARPLACGGVQPGSGFLLDEPETPTPRWLPLWEQILNRPKELSDGYAKLWTAQLGKGARILRGSQSASTKRTTHICFLYLPDASRPPFATTPTASSTTVQTIGGRGDTETMRQRVMGASKLLAKRTSLTLP